MRQIHQKLVRRDSKDRLRELGDWHYAHLQLNFYVGELLLPDNQCPGHNRWTECGGLFFYFTMHHANTEWSILRYTGDIHTIC